MGDDRTSETRNQFHPSSGSFVADMHHLEPHRKVPG